LNDAQGIPRWPAVPLEFFFNALLLGAAFLLRSNPFFKGQLFHLYLVAYGIFRFSHEFLRDTPPILLGLSGYQYAAIAITLLGGIGFWLRNRKRNISVWSPAQV
jgi:phosphatidylglycerol:prolipoprotein diacylglycerol transferase